DATCPVRNDELHWPSRIIGLRTGGHNRPGFREKRSGGEGIAPQAECSTAGGNGGGFWHRTSFLFCTGLRAAACGSQKPAFCVVVIYAARRRVAVRRRAVLVVQRQLDQEGCSMVRYNNTGRPSVRKFSRVSE